jgi:phosphoserine phosphatase
MNQSAPSTVTQRVHAIDASLPLQNLATLDVTADGKLSTADASAIERVAKATRAKANSASDAIFGADLLQYADQLDYSAQQARYGAAMLADGALPSGPTTVHNIVPTATLGQGTTPKDVIAAISAVDTKSLIAAGVKPVATFDVDGTSIKGDIYLPFIERMARERRFGAHANEVFRTALTKVGADPAVVAKNGANANALLLLTKIDPAARADTPTMLSNASGFFALGDAIVGEKLSDLQGVAKRLMELGVGTTPPYKQRINDDSPAPGDSVPEVVAALQANHITPHVVTWGFDFLAQVAAPYMGFDPANVVGTHAIVENGIVTGHNGTTVPSKDILVRQETGTVPLFAFGDSGTDLKMLDLAAARGIVVNPSASMRTAIDERKGAIGEVRYSSTVGETASGRPE